MSKVGYVPPQTNATASKIKALQLTDIDHG
jgi:hypothetical protein